MRLNKCGSGLIGNCFLGGWGKKGTDCRGNRVSLGDTGAAVVKPNQWVCLSDRAVLRFSRFPTISELYEIAWEIRQEAEIRANSARLRNDNA